MKIWLLPKVFTFFGVGIWVFSSLLFASDLSKTGRITPMFLGSSETDSLFRNPAELTLHEHFLEGRLLYGVSDKKFSGSFIIHLPDNLPIYVYEGWRDEKQKMILPLGDFGFSMEFFGSNFAQNILWIEDKTNKDSGGYFSLAEGGYRMLFTWAKKTRFFTVGGNLKRFYYRDIRSSDSTRNAIGVDLGFYFTPFEDLYLGTVVTDFGDTLLKDGFWNPITENGNTLKISQDILITAAVLSGQDMSFAIGVPLRFVNEIQKNPTQAWRRLSFMGRKVFDKTVEISGGYNSKDIFANMGLKLNEFIAIGLIGSRELFSSSSYTLMGYLTMAYPFQNAGKDFSGWPGHHPVQDTLYHQSRKDLKKNNERQAQQDEKEAEENAYKEVEEELNEQLKEIQKKKQTLKKIKKKEAIKKELDN